VSKTVSEQTENTMEFPALSAYQQAILKAMDIPLFSVRPDTNFSALSETKTDNVISEEVVAKPSLSSKVIPHPTLTITSDLQLFLADVCPDIQVFLNDDVVLDERGIGLPAKLNVTHKKQIWALLKMYLAATSA
jgi:hypothetical protein